MPNGVSKAVLNPLSILMNRSDDEGISDIWKHANAIPIYEAGEKSQPSKYILSSIGKRHFEYMFNFLIDNNLLYSYQSGFLPYHSQFFSHNISQALDNRIFSCIVFCNVSKTFESI